MCVCEQILNTKVCNYDKACNSQKEEGKDEEKECIDELKGDTLCHDINNHNDNNCNFDGGDCCGNVKPGWDLYCTV